MVGRWSSPAGTASTATAASRAGDNAATAMKSIVVDTASYDWEGDAPLHLPSARTIVYEMHVRGFTRHPNSGVGERVRGTYGGLIEKIPYLQALGITAVELLPVFQFDAQACPPGVVNYWGYQPVSFFAPHGRTAHGRSPSGRCTSSGTWSRPCTAGVEVILDVVFNHTAEGVQDGPILSLRGIDNPTYYILEDGGARYADYTGCANTLNANNPVVRRMIVDSLRYWVTEMHVDGFRFDLASILSRDSDGQPVPNPPVLWDIKRIRRSPAPVDCRSVGCHKFVRSATSSGTRGRDGIAGSATTVVISFAARPGRSLASPTGWSAVPRWTGTRAGKPTERQLRHVS